LVYNVLEFEFKRLGPQGELAGLVSTDKLERMVDELEKATGTGE